ncbi:MAG: metal ABC transporter substrate-binding protein [Bdellovibrionales bacterium]|nr:metal ABC transporter substrate-binding protein [Bdellovibrionales bacterium]
MKSITKCTKYILIISIIAYLPILSAKTLISCSHPELCKLAEFTFKENQMLDFEFVSLVKIVGDPHEYEPRNAEVKNLINADILITGPAELNPWIKKVNYQRSKNTNLKTILLPLNKTDLALYAKDGTLPTSEALSHFWLYPKVMCSIKTNLEKQLVALKMLVVLPSNKACLPLAEKIEADLRVTLSTVNFPLVLTHDALLPLLEKLSQRDTQIVAIKGSGHHQETTPKAVKNLYDALRGPRVIWIEEESIRVPQNVLAKKRSTDITIKIDTAHSEGPSLFPVLVELNEKLKANKI